MRFLYRSRKPKYCYHIADGEGAVCKLHHSTCFALIDTWSDVPPANRRLCSTCSQLSGISIPLSPGEAPIPTTSQHLTKKERRKARKERKRLAKASPSKAQPLKPKKQLSSAQIAFIVSDDFLQSYEWRKCRYEALKGNDGTCCLCGRGKPHGAILNVDHIKPRRKFPELALTVSNCQVLCHECNHGKGNWDSTDWR